MHGCRDGIFRKITILKQYFPPACSACGQHFSDGCSHLYPARQNAARIITDKGETIERRPDGLAGYDSRWVRRQSGIREVEVYLEEDLLKEHLVLIDMPGIGGVKEEADRSFYQLLPETQQG